MRFIDDMIFITPSLEMASEFVDTIGGGFPEYGFRVNQHKTVANFDHLLIENIVLDRQKGFPWCGLYLDQMSLDVKADYSKFFGSCTSNFKLYFNYYSRYQRFFVDRKNSTACGGSISTIENVTHIFSILYEPSHFPILDF